MESTKREKDVKLVSLGIFFPIKICIFIIDVVKNVNKQQEENDYSAF